MSKKQVLVSKAQNADIPEVLSLLVEFEAFLESALHIRNLIEDGQETQNNVKGDYEKNLFSCHVARTTSGEPLGITISSTSHLAGIGPVLLLTIIYARERRLGIGKTLLTHIIKEAESKFEQRLGQVHFFFNRDNHSAWEFYKWFSSRNLTQDTGFLVFQFRFPDELRTNSSVHVRTAKKDDLPPVIELFTELCCIHSVPIWSRKQLEEGKENFLKNVFVAEEIKEDGSSEILGLVSFYCRYSVVSGCTPTILGLVVKEGHRRLGIGSSLINRLYQEFSETGHLNGNVLLPPDKSSPVHHFFARFPDTINRTEEDTWNYCLFDRPEDIL